MSSAFSNLYRDVRSPPKPRISDNARFRRWRKSSPCLFSASIKTSKALSGMSSIVVVLGRLKEGCMGTTARISAHCRPVSQSCWPNIRLHWIVPRPFCKWNSVAVDLAIFMTPIKAQHSGIDSFWLARIFKPVSNSAGCYVHPRSIVPWTMLFWTQVTSIHWYSSAMRRMF